MSVTEDDKASLQEALGYGFDKTGADLAQVLRTAGYDVSDADAQQLADAAGIKKDAPLTIDALCIAAGKVDSKRTAATLLAAAFKPMDKFEDGTLTNKDLRQVLANMGDLKQDELDMIIEDLDAQDAGRVFLDDVLHAFQQRLADSANAK